MNRFIVDASDLRITKPDNRSERAKSKTKTKGGAGDGETLREYWTEDPEGLAKWVNNPHPWTTLHAHLIKYMKEPLASKVTSSYYYEVFGTSPSGKNKKRYAEPTDGQESRSNLMGDQATGCQCGKGGDESETPELERESTKKPKDNNGDSPFQPDTEEHQEDESERPFKKKQDEKSGRSAMRDLPVIRSATVVADLLDESGNQLAETSCRASYRADIETNGPLMRLEFSKFNNWYPIESTFEGKFLERVAPGAFVKTINERANQVKVLFNHGKDAQIGEKILGPISILEERTDGTYAEVALLDTSYNRDIVPGLRAGVYGSSFMFHVMDDKWDNRPERSAHNPDGLPERTVTAVRLLEFGPVTWPANPQSTAGVRSDTDRYFSDLRSNDPEMYDSIAQRFSEFRASNHLVPRTSDQGVDQANGRQDTPDHEAAQTTDAPDRFHASGLSPDQRAAQLRSLQLLELS